MFDSLLFRRLSCIPLLEKNSISSIVLHRINMELYAFQDERKCVHEPGNPIGTNGFAFHFLGVITACIAL